MDFEEESRYLRSGYFEALLIAAGIIFVIPFLRAAAWRDSPHLFYTWQVATALGAGIWIAQMLRHSRPYLARWVFVLSLTVATSYEVLFFPAGPALQFFPVIVIAAGLLMSDRESPIAVSIAVLAIVATTSLAWPQISLERAWWAIVVVVIAGFVSYLGARQLYTVLRWEWESTQSALRATREAQDHRAELLRLNKELDSAYNRIDRINRMLVLARQEAEQARMLKVQFANAVSHELRSPLNMIIGFSEMMVNAPEVYGVQTWSPRLRNHIQQIYQSAQHLSQLVDDVLDLARINADRLTLVKEPTCIADVIQESVNIVRGLYDARGLYLRVEAESDLPLVSLDRIRIRQVLLNLLTNAVRFTEQGGVTIRVQATKTPHPQPELIVSVSDTGIGIPPTELPRLFQEFRQLDGAFFRWQRGSGLGLAVSRQLIELHGGRIWAESQLGIGSTFSFALPIQPDLLHLAANADSQRRDHADEERFWSLWERNARARKPVVAFVPVADGSDESAHHTRRLLSTHLTNCDISWVANEQALLKSLDEARPLAVIQAMHDARDINQALALAMVLNGIPLISCALPGLARQPLPPSISDYLVKPISRQRIIQALRDSRCSRRDQPIACCLIIEDDPAMQDYLELVIEATHPTVDVLRATNATEVWDILAHAQPDVAFLDLNLPDTEGFDLAERIRERFPSLPIIVVTARDYPTDENEDELDVFLCARQGKFNQTEIHRLLNGMLDALSPIIAIKQISTDAAEPKE
ncbi:MAG: hybrid sensor histidine kinase/response regulator [Anaerolineae bacterium]|nr:hybrid sensor histidine kinase/response regulator [Candidatus Roseilinea sp.]MDW8450746.1 hybrid sensor histidine kinase/response regulator [Anaerolineae bacterium]